LAIGLPLEDNDSFPSSVRFGDVAQAEAEADQLEEFGLGVVATYIIQGTDDGGVESH